MSRLAGTLQRCSVLLGKLQMSHGPKLQHHLYSTKGMYPTTEVTEADMLQLKPQGLRLTLPGFKFRQICQA